MIASAYEDKKVDVIMTVATKGVPIAQTVANYLNVPLLSSAVILKLQREPLSCIKLRIWFFFSC